MFSMIGLPNRRVSRIALLGSLLAASPAAPLAAPLAAQAGAPLMRDVVRADDGHGLVLWSKRPSHGAPRRGAILLLHGATWSARPNFDLRVPGANASLMDALGARGFAVYALDQRGYGDTPRDTSGWLTPIRAARDAAEVLDWITQRAARGARRPVVIGYSRGSQTTTLLAQRNPEKLSAAVLYGFAVDLSKPVRQAKLDVPPRVRTTAEGAAEDFITPEFTPAGVKDAYVRAALAHDSIKVDWRHEEELDAIDVATLKVPVLVLNGERDPVANHFDVATFFKRLNGVDRQWSVLAHADHVAHLERQREWVDAVTSFVEQTRSRP